MPRPGPRPYECVRRAWHSDRHQPIRGSLIQEIFRLANEFHNLTTRKNKEWLEKLPTVVFKAEEIMYSKANSEAEYMNLKTLWDRANDAIDTIIRKDDTPETEGDLLQPCIEAALNLGCIPRRASRSQRHNNPECYLSSVNKGSHLLGSSVHLLPENSLSRLESWYSAFVTANTLKHVGNEAHSVILNDPSEPKDSVKCPSLGHVYPYYGNVQPQYPGVYTVPTVCEKDASFLNSFFKEASKDPCEGECDLSLRLGMFSPPSLDEEMVSIHEVDDVGSSSSGGGTKYSDPSQGETRALNRARLIPIDINDEPLESY